MSRARVVTAVVAASIVVVAGTLRPRGHAPSTTAPRPPGATATPPPATPTPVPWLGSSLGFTAPNGRGQVLALVGAGGAEPPRALVDGFDAVEDPAWSRDGERLAFAARRDDNWDVYVASADGGDVHRLTTSPAYDGSPAWSPDGATVAFVSMRDGALAIYRVQVAADAEAAESSSLRVSGDAAPALDPTWSPDGRSVVYASWEGGRFRLVATNLADASDTVVAEDDARDLRHPCFAPDGTLGYLALEYGVGELRAGPWAPGSPGGARTLATRVAGFAWFPGGGAVAVVSPERSGRRLEIRPLAGGPPQLVAQAGSGPTGIGWRVGPVPTGLALLADPAPPLAADAEARPGLATLDGVDVPGARINAALADDFQALRADVRAATGRDFLGTLADGWRPLGFKSSGSAFFSWHKTGRAFDTQMDARGPGGRRDMVLVRDEGTGRTMWRMYLRAGAQDGSVGRPLEAAGWTFTAGGGAKEYAAEGGRSGDSVPAGYWVDFTALAESYGWFRIPSARRGSLDWRSSFTGIEYWHYERRDGLSWYQAARQIYPDATLAAELSPERLRELGVRVPRRTALGFPAGWPGEG